MLSGAFIGSKITMDTVKLIISMWYNAILVLAIFIPACLLLGYALHKWRKLDLLTALFCSAPAGASDMALIASDVGADGPNVAILQIIRMLGVIAIFPHYHKNTCGGDGSLSFHQPCAEALLSRIKSFALFRIL